MKKLLGTTLALLFLTTAALHAFQSNVIPLESFDALKCNMHGTVRLVQGSKEEAEIAYTNIDENEVEVRVVNGVLIIDMIKDFKLFKNPKIEVTLYYNTLRKATLNGAVTLITENTLEGEILELRVDGAGTIDIDVQLSELWVSMDGAGSMSLRGQTDMFDVSLDGAGSLRAEDLLAQIVSAKLDGVGSMNVHATKKLTARVDGLGSIRYAGRPKDTKFYNDGLGKIKPLN